MITLKEFVKQTLSEIADAMTEFAEEKKGDGWNPMPRLQSDQHAKIGPGFMSTIGFGTAMIVEFEVAVTAEEVAEGGGKAGGTVLSVLTLEAGGKMTATNTTASRISFPIPLQLPDIEE